jgi:hypothetical protein
MSPKVKDFIGKVKLVSPSKHEGEPGINAHTIIMNLGEGAG